MYNINESFSFHMELTDKCNARCVQCERNFIDKDGELKERPELLLTEISIDQYKKIFENYQKQTYHLTFCGNTGDPLFVKDILEITEYSITNVMSEGYSKLQIYTNGGYRSKEWWSNYGKLLKNVNHMIIFAIDGLEDTHHLYRVNTRYDRVIENARAFIDAGGVAEWSFIRFGHNQHQEDEAKKRAKQLGFKSFTASNSERFHREKKIDYKWKGDLYSISRYDPTVLKTLNADEKKAIQTNKQLQTNSENYWKDVEKSRLESSMQINCYTEKKNELYIDSRGYVYPCCWVGHYEYMKLVGIDDAWNPQIDGRTFTSSWDKDFREILKEDWFEHQLPESWETDPCHICARHCGKNIMKTIRHTSQI